MTEQPKFAKFGCSSDLVCSNFFPVKTNYLTKSIMLSYCHKQVDFSQALTLDSCSVTLFKVGLTVKAAFQSHFHWKYKYIQTFS